MATLEEMQSKAFKIISTVGEAKSLYIQATREGIKGDFNKANQLFEKGEKIFNESHKEHFSLIQEEADGKELPFSLILVHAEDQLLNTETIYTLSKEIIELRKEIENISSTL